MASFAKDSLSPLLKSANARRRSLEICQTIGNHLLSPTTAHFVLSPSSPTSATSPCKSSGGSPFKLLSPSISEALNNVCKAGTNLTAAFRSQRRASDSAWLEALPNKEPILQDVQNFQKRRFSYQGSPLRLEPGIVSQLQESADGDVWDGDSENQENVDSTRMNRSQQPLVTCNVIPPTPLRDKEPKFRAPVALKSSIDGDHLGGVILDENKNYKEKIRNKKRSSSSDDLENISPAKSARQSGVKYDLDESLIQCLISNWKLTLHPHELLGKGSYGTVIGGVYKGREVAVKVLKTTTVQRKASVLGEYNALNLPFHNHIAPVIEILNPYPTQTMIIMKKMEKGNLLSLLNDPTFKINCAVAINISKQIALALVFCHREGILHLDVKPQNILVDHHNCYKLSDFGSSKKISNLKAGQKFSALEGTVPYTAPELFTGATPTEKCDVYGFGITMWQILTREIPYENENEHSVIFRVVSEGLRPSTRTCDVTNSLSNSYSDLERNLTLKYAQLYETAWDSNPPRRPSMTDVHKSLIEIQLL